MNTITGKSLHHTSNMKKSEVTQSSRSHFYIYKYMPDIYNNIYPHPHISWLVTRPSPTCHYLTAMKCVSVSDLSEMVSIPFLASTSAWLSSSSWSLTSVSCSMFLRLVLVLASFRWYFVVSQALEFWLLKSLSSSSITTLSWNLK